MLVTHDQEEALAISDEIVCMSQAKIQQIGSPMSLYHKPQNTFIAKFIGVPEMFIFEGTFEEGKGFVNQVAFQIKNLPVFSDKETKTASKEAGLLLFGVRAEDIVLDKNGSFEGEVVAIEELGKERRATVVSKLFDKAIQMNLPPHLPVTVKEMVRFSFLPDKIHVFSPSGERLN